MKPKQRDFLRTIHSPASVDPRRSLVERVAASRYFSKSARLRDLLLYLTDRVLDGDVDEIHEQEVGFKVFGRPANYDTSSDNIVRVHASMLRKRLEQYFASEGADEPMVVEIRKGNYAPIFHARPEVEFVVEPSLAQAKRTLDWRLPALATACIALALSTTWLLVTNSKATLALAPPTVKAFWGMTFRADKGTDIVMDDAAVGLYQELTGRSISLSDYFDRDYLRGLPDSTTSDLGGRAAASIVLRRQSSFSAANVLWKIMSIPGLDRSHSALRFARDYSFRELKADNAILLGNGHTNPWVESFAPRVGIRWEFDAVAGIYFPVDTWSGGKAYRADSTGDMHEGYCAVAMLPNVGGTNVLTIAGTGGSAINAGIAFLSDDRLLSDLRNRLGGERSRPFPHFELLLRVAGRAATLKDVRPEIVRAIRDDQTYK